MISQKANLLKFGILPKINTLSALASKNKSEESQPWVTIQEEMKKMEQNAAVVSAMDATAELVNTFLADGQMVDKMKKHPAYAKLEQLLEAKRLPSNETESVNLLLTDCTDRITCMSCGQAVPGADHQGNPGFPGRDEHVSEAVRNTVMLAVVTLVAGLVFKFHPKIAIGFYKAAWTSVLKFLKGAVYQPSFNPFK